MVITPDVINLSFVVKKGIKYFELIAQPVQGELLNAGAWGSIHYIRPL